jgi:hypothetical protein
MNTSKLLQVVVLGSTFLTLSARATTSLSESKESTEPESIPWSELGAKAGADYKGDGLAVFGIGNSARLHCDFQRLEGEATHGGLWLTSTVTNQAANSFRVKATAVGRQKINPEAEDVSPLQSKSRELEVVLRKLPPSGTVSVDGQTVRFTRPGLVEEYSVNVDGVRQDFVVFDKPDSSGELRLDLAVSGAQAKQTAYGAELVLDKSRRGIAYSRLKVTDASGKELPARMQSTCNSEMTLAILVNDTDAVYPIRVDPTFSDANWVSMGGIPGADSQVFAAVVDGLGNLYIGGDFTTVGNAVANRVAKWDGNAWSALGSGVNNTVQALAVSGSNLYAGGKFTTAGGAAANYIAKWNGSSWSALGSGMNNYVSALAVSGGDLYAGGYFTTAGGVAGNRVAKWNGSSWTALGSGMNDYVSTLAVSGSGLYAGGNFTTAGGVVASRVAKWNGSSWSALGAGMSGEVRALAVSGSDMYAGGQFTTATNSGGVAVTVNYIAKWDGTSWSALGAGMNYWVYALAVSGSDIYAGGYFNSAGGSTAKYTAKWDGSNWSALNSGMDTWVYAIAVSGSNVFAGGGFVEADGRAANFIAKWNGSSWSALGSGLNGNVYALAVSGSDQFAGGVFWGTGGINVNRIAKRNGSSWARLGSGMDGEVRALAISGDNLYAGGAFTTAGGVSANCIARGNGSSWSWSALGSGMNTAVNALAASGSNVYAGGTFTTAGGSAASRIAKWDGSSWSTLGLGMNNAVSALAVSGSNVFAGGQFTTVTNTGGVAVSANRIAKWDGNSWSTLGLGMNNVVSALAVSGSNVFAGGQFTTVTNTGGVAVSANRIAKWDGNSWSALGAGINGEVRALAVLGGDVYAGGQFTTATNSGGVAVTVNYIAKWNGSSWSALGSGMNYWVHALAVSGSDMYAGGVFKTAGGTVSAFITRAVLGDAPGYNEITGSPLSGGGMQFSYIGSPGTNYALDRTFNLSPPVTWTPQVTNTMSVSGVMLFTNTPVPATNNFWRVRLIP